MKQHAFYALVRGKVQGVGFRYSAVTEAQKLKITGWVKNAASGDVEVWAEGTQVKLDLFLEWLRRGPSWSRVDSVKKEEMIPKGYDSFGIQH